MAFAKRTLGLVAFAASFIAATPARSEEASAVVLRVREEPGSVVTGPASPVRLDRDWGYVVDEAVAALRGQIGLFGAAPRPLYTSLRFEAVKPAPRPWEVRPTAALIPPPQVVAIDTRGQGVLLLGVSIALP